QRVRRGGKTNCRHAAIEDFHEVIAERCTAIAASTIDLTDDQICDVIILNRPLAACVGDSGAPDVRQVYEEYFVAFYQRVAVDHYLEGVGCFAGLDRLSDEI